MKMKAVVPRYYEILIEMTVWALAEGNFLSRKNSDTVLECQNSQLVFLLHAYWQRRYTLNPAISQLLDFHVDLPAILILTLDPDQDHTQVQTMYHCTRFHKDRVTIQNSFPKCEPL